MRGRHPPIQIQIRHCSQGTGGQQEVFHTMKVLSPFVGVMNRLSYAGKFAVVGALFSILIAVLAVLLLGEFGKRISDTEKELTGLGLVEIQLDVYRESAHLRDVITAQRFFASDALATVLDRQRGRTTETLAGKGPGVYASLPQSALQWRQFRDEQEARLKDLSSTDDALNQVFAVESAPIQTLVTLIRTTAWETGLTRDADSVNALITEFLTRTQVQPLEIASELRAYGLEVTSERFLQNIHRELLNTTLFRFNAAVVEYAAAARALATAEPRLEDALRRAMEAQQALVQFMDQHIMNAQRLRLRPPEFDEQFSALIDAVLTPAGELRKILQARLEDRLDAERQQRNFVLIAIVTVLAALTLLSIAFYQSVRSAVHRMVGVVRHVAEGDLTVSVSLANRDEMGQLSRALDQMIGKVSELIRATASSSDQVNQQASQMRSVAEHAQEVVTRQREDIQSVSESIEQVSRAAESVSDSAHRAAEGATTAHKGATSGLQELQRALDRIRELDEQVRNSVALTSKVSDASERITQILDVIKSIASQTNLLALNAAIEAARAGEQGRGFAVVADEVRKLAQHTQGSTEQIEGMIAELRAGVTEAVQCMESSQRKAAATVEQSTKVGAVLETIAHDVTEIKEMNRNIAEAASEQTRLARDVGMRIGSINEGGARATTAGNETRQASEALIGLTGRLNALLGNFKVG